MQQHVGEDIEFVFYNGIVDFFFVLEVAVHGAPALAGFDGDFADGDVVKSLQGK